MRYCPKCCAYQHDQLARSCRKCGFDFTEHEKKLKADMERKLSEDRTQDEEAFGRYDTESPCPECGAPTRPVERTLEVPVEGSKVMVQDLKVMGGDMNKRSVNQYQIDITGMECYKGHRFYRTFQYREKLLCPLCLGPMIRYGSAILSCNRCNKHYSLGDWAKADPVKLLEDEGWKKH
jgi:ribosomal protein L37AE/L43A